MATNSAVGILRVTPHSTASSSRSASRPTEKSCNHKVGIRWHPGVGVTGSETFDHGLRERVGSQVASQVARLGSIGEGVVVSPLDGVRHVTAVRVPVSFGQMVEHHHGRHQ